MRYMLIILFIAGCGDKKTCTVEINSSAINPTERKWFVAKTTHELDYALDFSRQAYFLTEKEARSKCLNMEKK